MALREGVAMVVLVSSLRAEVEVFTSDKLTCSGMLGWLVSSLRAVEEKSSWCLVEESHQGFKVSSLCAEEEDVQGRTFVSMDHDSVESTYSGGLRRLFWDGSI